jgi:hypothetical protein
MVSHAPHGPANPAVANQPQIEIAGAPRLSSKKGVKIEYSHTSFPKTKTAVAGDSACYSSNAAGTNTNIFTFSLATPLKRIRKHHAPGDITKHGFSAQSKHKIILPNISIWMDRPRCIADNIDEPGLLQ